MRIFILLFVITLTPVESSGHSGGVNSDGCHNKTSDNTYHCHDKRGNLGALYFFISVILIYFLYSYIEKKGIKSNQKDKKDNLKISQHNRVNSTSKASNYNGPANRNKTTGINGLSKEKNDYLQDQDRFRRAKIESSKRISNTSKEHRANQHAKTSTTDKIIRDAMKASGLNIDTIIKIIKAYKDAKDSTKVRQRENSPTNKNGDEK